MQSTRTCSVDGCDNTIHPKRMNPRHMCTKHNQRFLRHGDASITHRVYSTGCKVEGCTGTHRAHGYCDRHANNFLRHGVPQTKYSRELPIEEKFWGFVEPTGFCWDFIGATDRSGYGSYRSQGAHRVAYELLVGPIPDGLELDHLCRNTHCVNPDHLEPVTKQENLRRLHAIRGHEISAALCCDTISLTLHDDRLDKPRYELGYD